MIKIKMLRNTMAKGKFLELGQIYEVSEADAEILIVMGKAERFIEEPETEEEKKPELEVLTTEKAKPLVKKTTKKRGKK